MNKVTVENLKNYIRDEITTRGLENNQIEIDFTDLFTDVCELQEAATQLGFDIEKDESIGFGMYWIYK